MPDYPFVRSHVDLGTASGPRLAVAWHMAEGGGTVGFLSRPNVHGVSVHFVVEKSGRTVQMLQLSHMHTSIRVSAIRVTDDPPYDWDGKPITYGGTAAKTVLGSWWKNPNNASIGVEVEGFARDGPNPAQTVAIGALWDDMASRYPKMRSLGHRDFASYKQCPGKKFPWDLVGHGPSTGDDMAGLATTPLDDQESGIVRIPAGIEVIRVDTSERIEIGPDGATRHGSGIFVREFGNVHGYFIRHADVTCWVDKANVAFEPYDAPAPDCKAAITADRAKAKIVYGV